MTALLEPTGAGPGGSAVGDRTEDVYRSAMALFAARPYVDVTVRDICDRAAISRPTFFRWFESKERLLVEFDHRLAARLAVVRLDGSTPAPAALWRVHDELLAAWWVSPAFAHTMATETRRWRGGGPLHREVRHVVAEGQQRGQLAPGPEPALVAHVVLASVAAATLVDLDDGAVGRATAQAMTLLLDGLAGPVASP